MGFEVNDKLCSTCIFGGNSPIPRARFEQLKTEWETAGVVQECHHATLKNQHIGCRGHYESARAGLIKNHPIVTAAAEGLGLTGLSIDVIMDVSERLGLVHFVDVESLPTLEGDSDE